MALAMQKLPELSVCMIAGAEASRIARALESVQAWAGEIALVLNDDVKDDTEAIASRFGARIFREPWKGFVGQKNSAADKASGTWLLNLDADEIVSAPLAEEIAGVVANAEGS